MIDFTSVNDYDDIENLNITFNGAPRKDLETDIYKVYIEEPLLLQLPKSSLLEMNEGPHGQTIAKYALTDESLLEFLDNLDAHMINLSNKYSVKWFGKNLEQKLLIKFYSNIYSIENNTKYINFELDDDELDELSNYNIEK